MKCDTCLHFTVCKYKEKLLGSINPYEITKNETEAQNCYSHLWGVLDNCKFFKRRPNT